MSGGSIALDCCCVTVVAVDDGSLPPCPLPPCPLPPGSPPPLTGSSGASGSIGGGGGG